MDDLEYFRKAVFELSKFKNWNDSEIWLERSLFVECGELAKAIEEKKSPEEIAEEGADVLHYLFQILNLRAPQVDLNKAMQDKINSNYKTPKKSWIDGVGIVRK